MKTQEELKSERAAYMRSWRDRNIEACRAKATVLRQRPEAKALQKKYAKDWYLKNKERTLSLCKKWKEDNKYRAMCLAKAASANKRYEGILTPEHVDEIIKKCNYTCHWCKKENLTGRDLTLEHLERINDPQHIVIACLACNSARIPDRGPRKTAEEKNEHARNWAREWRDKNRERYNARWGRMTDEQRQARRKYMTEYMRKRRALKKEA